MEASGVQRSVFSMSMHSALMVCTVKNNRITGINICELSTFTMRTRESRWLPSFLDEQPFLKVITRNISYILTKDKVNTLAKMTHNTSKVHFW